MGSDFYKIMWIVVLIFTGLFFVANWTEEKSRKEAYIELIKKMEHYHPLEWSNWECDNIEMEGKMEEICAERKYLRLIPQGENK